MTLLALGAVLVAQAPARADDPAAAAVKSAVATLSAPAAQTTFVKAITEAISALPAPGNDPERKDREALAAFYQARQSQGLWVSGFALTPVAKSLMEAVRGADAYGLDPAGFRLPAETAPLASPAEQAGAELQLTLAALTYARYARGGRIADPIEMLSPNLDHRPQWLDPKAVLDGLVAAPDARLYLAGLNPKHVQFERLRQLYDAEIAKAGHNGKLSALAKHLRANMEMWRWMPDDMGTQTGSEDKGMYVFNNIPEFTQYVYRDGEIVRTEKIVVGELGKQSAVFSRPLKFVVLRPMWRVPESIEVNEVWPGLIKGGRIMRRYGLEVQSKDGKTVDWHKIDWASTDIRQYDLIQPPGPLSVLGHVKFSFPSQHTIYMHDTPDKYMFNAAVRTLSHGCLRVRNPMALAEMVLKEDKGWDAAKVAELDKSGPLNNEVPIDKRIPIHVAYFTAWVDARGKLKSFPDIYGHEKRVTLALDGQWSKIDHGKDDQAPVEPNFDPRALAVKAGGATADDPFAGGGKGAKGEGGGLGDLFSTLFGG